MTNANTTLLKEMERGMKRAKGRDARTHTIAVRVTDEEKQLITKRAEAAGEFVGEFIRETLMKEVKGEVTDRAIFTELIAMRLLLINTLGAIGTGRLLHGDEFKEILAQVRTHKHTAAADLLDQYRDPLGIKPE